MKLVHFFTLFNKFFAKKTHTPTLKSIAFQLQNVPLGVL
jgi:hypothetical protein